MSKTRIAVCMLLLLLSLSLFTALNILPVEATVENESLGLDAFALKEYKQWSAYNPAYTFSKSSSSILQVMSTTTGLGQGYVFMHVERSYLHGKKLSVRWRWFADWSGGSYELAKLYVVDNAHHRRNSDGEFRTQGDIEHPIAGYTSVYVMGRSTTANGGWVSWETRTETVNLAGFRSPVVTILFKTNDDWVGFRSGMEIDYLRILSPSNEVLKEYEFGAAQPKNVFMDITGSTGDYGLIRRPTSMLYGTRAYAMAPGGECDLSGEVSAFIYALFWNTGKYGYLANSWGANTQSSTVYATTDSTERYYDYSAVFYKGHIWLFGSNCNNEPCQLLHWGLWNDDGTQGIADYFIDDEVIEVIEALNKFAGTHDFVFIWACGHGSNEKVGVFNEDHSAGLLSSWMHINPKRLSNNGYLYPDNSDHVFIGFEWLSIWYKTEATNPTYNYGHWAYLFYDYVLQGYSVNAALDQASKDTHYGSLFGQCQLYNGYWLWNPHPDHQRYERSRMRVWGDGNHRLPR